MEALQKRLNQLSFLKSRIPQAKELANMQDNLVTCSFLNSLSVGCGAGRDRSW